MLRVPSAALALLAALAPVADAAPPVPLCMGVCVWETESGADRCDEGPRDGRTYASADAIHARVTAYGATSCDGEEERRDVVVSARQPFEERTDVRYAENGTACDLEATGGPRSTGTEWRVANACTAGPLPDPGWGDVGSHVETHSWERCYTGPGFRIVCVEEASDACGGTTRVFVPDSPHWAEGAATCDGDRVETFQLYGSGFAYARWADGPDGCVAFVYVYDIFAGAHRADLGCPAGGPPNPGWGALVP